MRVDWLFIQEIVLRATHSRLRRAILPALLCALAAGALAQTGAVPGRDRRIRPQVDTPSVSALPAKGKRFALLIGVDEYQDPNISRLHGAANDAKAMKQVLVQHAGFPADQVVVLASGEAPTLAPTRANILTRLSNMLSIVPKDGLLLFQFSGHGIERQRRPFLLPADAQLQDNPRMLEQLAVSLDFVRTAIEEAGIAQVLVLLDACRNEPGGRANDDNLLTANFVDGLQFERRNAGVKAFATLFATEQGYRAWEDMDRKRGFFSHALESGLKGEAANESGEVTLGSLLSYLQERVPRRVSLALGSTKKQLPYARVEGFRANDLVLAMAPRSVPNVSGGGPDLCALAWEIVKDANSRQPLENFVKDYPDCQYATLARLKLSTMREPAAVPPPAPVQVRREPQAGDVMEALDLGRGVKMEFVYIPAGTFWMGCSPGDNACIPHESPRRRVTITRAFEIGKYEVTQGEWEAVMGTNPSYFKGTRKPVENVSWLDAQEFVRKLNARNDGYRYRLPSEAEWEYAARAGAEGKYYGGEVRDLGWFGDNSGDRLLDTKALWERVGMKWDPYWEELRKGNPGTKEVGGKTPNAWGLYDMLGNVYEWCEDWYGDGYYREQANQDPKGPSSGESRMVRGGSWYDVARGLRLSGRFRLVPSVRGNSVGFRCLRERR